MITILREDERGLILHAPTKAEMRRCEEMGGRRVATYYQRSGDPVEGDYRFTPEYRKEAERLLVPSESKI
jgi:hypothetical protein